MTTDNTSAAFASSTLAVSRLPRVTATVAGACAGTGCASSRPGQGALAFAAATTITDAAGNAAAGTFTTAATFRAF